MEPIDIVLKQIEDSTRYKDMVRKVNERYKLMLAHEMPDLYDKTNIDSNLVVDTVTFIRNELKKARTYEADLKFLELLLIYQYMLYTLSNNIDDNQLNTYAYYMDNHEKIYKDLCNKLINFDNDIINYSIDLSIPLSMQFDNIKRHCNSLQIAVKAIYKMMSYNVAKDNKGLAPFLIFHQEVIGNKREWELKTLEWHTCYNAYKLHFVDGLDKSIVIKKLAKSPFRSVTKFNLEDMSNAIHKLDRILEEARQLIASTENGTFPC